MLHQAARRGDENILKRLLYNNKLREMINLKKGKIQPIDLQSHESDRKFADWTPLHVAAYYARLNSVKLLVTNLADPSVKTKIHLTALHLACDQNID